MTMTTAMALTMTSTTLQIQTGRALPEILLGAAEGTTFNSYYRLTIGSNRSLRSLGRAKARPLTKRYMPAKDRT